MSNKQKTPKTFRTAIIAAVIVIAVLTAFIFIIKPTITNRAVFDEKQNADYGFASAIEPFENQQIFAISPENFSVTAFNPFVNLDVSVMHLGGYIYKKGYYLGGGNWVPFTFAQPTIGNSSWIPDSATSSLIINSTGTLANGFDNYVLAYSCKKYQKIEGDWIFNPECDTRIDEGCEWKCGCLGDKANCDRWMLHYFEVEGMNENNERPTSVSCEIDSDCRADEYCVDKICVLGIPGVLGVPFAQPVYKTMQGFMLAVGYNKPTNAISALYWIRHGDYAIYNITIPHDCWVQNSTAVNLVLASSDSRALCSDISTTSCSSGTNAYSAVYCNNGVKLINIGKIASEAIPAGSSSLFSGGLGNSGMPTRISDGSWNTYNAYTFNGYQWVTNYSLKASRIYEGTMQWISGDGVNCNYDDDCLDAMKYCRADKKCDWKSLGSGTAADPFKIFDANGLSAINSNLGANYSLQKDIDFNNGGLRIGSIDTPFTGIFEGNNHSISRIVFGGDANGHRVGLFASIGAKGIVRNIRLFNVRGGEAGFSNYVGSLASYNYGKIINAGAEDGIISGSGTCGGLVAMNYGSITSSYSKVSINCQSTIGGFVGHNYGLILNSYAMTDNLAGLREVGGFVGTNDNLITNCYSSANITLSQYSIASDTAGGFVGNIVAPGKISNSFSLGTVTKNNLGTIGGFVGNVQNGVGVLTNDYYYAPLNCYGTGSYTNGLCQQKTDLEYFKDKRNAPIANWNLTAMWARDPVVNKGYPFLKSESLNVAVLTNVSLNGACTANDQCAVPNGCHHASFLCTDCGFNGCNYNGLCYRYSDASPIDPDAICDNGIWVKWR